ncbi:class I SAM-dependent methyltransferase [Marinicella rhabdoformis]|uniref:class I SAM-dependent methyltransferase n=1 Tax=Marinicella rhabdoformis TaxID=2580566 RepID=UPI0012AED786|nr:class I SAM-dependent methyltransferase [Marinicella rhabdoformis]
MNFSRNLTNAIRFILDECIPPILRDKKWFMWLPFRVIFGKQSKAFFNFKNNFNNLDDDEISKIYKETSSVHFSRLTDLNSKCIKKIMDNICGEKVLDAGCGRGFLTNLLKENHQVTGVDFVKSEHFEINSPNVEFISSSVTKLPFSDNSFDTVICSHTLEHVKDIHTALSELRRVCKSNLIIVVPKQRPYKYTFDLHVHFFPYVYEFKKLVSFNKKFKNDYTEVLDGDIYHQEYSGNEDRL